MLNSGIVLEVCLYKTENEKQNPVSWKKQKHVNKHDNKHAIKCIKYFLSGKSHAFNYDQVLYMFY